MSTRASIPLRAAVPADLDAMLALRLRAVRGVADPTYDARHIEAWATWPMDGLVDAATRGRDVVVALDDGAIAGFAWTTRGDRPHLSSLYVDPALARRGIGSALIGEAERALRRQGEACLWIAATANAVDFYRRQGYQLEAEFSLPMAHARDGVVMPLFKMTKLLAG